MVCLHTNKGRVISDSQSKEIGPSNWFGLKWTQLLNGKGKKTTVIGKGPMYLEQKILYYDRVTM